MVLVVLFVADVVVVVVAAYLVLSRCWLLFVCLCVCCSLFVVTVYRMVLLLDVNC